MCVESRIAVPSIPKSGSAISVASDSKKNAALVLNFSKFKLFPINLREEFNNFFKDIDHFAAVASNFLGIIVPKINTLSYNEICDGTQEGKGLHFHTIHQSHYQLIRNILIQYGYAISEIEQILEGNSLFEFVASQGHIYAARVVCYKVENVLFLLFFDTNHHIYLEQRRVKDSFFYEYCPNYLSNNCKNMPYDCLAMEFLDEQKYYSTYGFTYSPVE